MNSAVRIWYQSTTELAACPRYARALEDHFAELSAVADIEVELFGAPLGTWAGAAPSDYIASPASYVQLLAQPLLANVVAAQERGYDAFVIGSYTEPFLRECRSLVDIPVVGVAESSLLISCSYAKTFALVTLNDVNAWFLKNAVERYGLSQRVSGVYTVHHSMDEQQIDSLFDHPAEYADAFVATARTAIDAYADLIVPAEGLVAELVHQAGVTEIDSVPVLDGIGVPVLHAAMLAGLRRLSGIHPGRRWHYVKAPPRVRTSLGASAEQ